MTTFLRHVWDRTMALLPRADDWRRLRPTKDLTAGVMVGLVALPLALGFGASSGMGAAAGLTTAIVAGALATIFGGSRVQVSGPTGAMTVVLVPIIATHGPDGVLVVGIIAGLILVGLAYARAGRVIRYVPIPVIEGFTLGIAIIIGLQQIPAALGVEVQADRVLLAVKDAVMAWLAAPSWGPALLAAGVVVFILGLERLRRGAPGALIAVVIATLVNEFAGVGADRIGALPAGLPAPSLPAVPWAHLDALILPAVAVAALAALESLLSATVADGMSVGTRHDSDRELLGQGVANLASPLFGGIPATAAIARTAVNIRAGAVSRLAALTHAVVLLLIVLIAARLVSAIPLAALAGVLIATAVHMVRVSAIRPLLRATRGDAMILVTTAVATVVFDLVMAVILGLIVAGFIALRRTARTARLTEMPLEPGDHTEAERELLDNHIVAYRLGGPLFFAAAHDFLIELTQVRNVRVVILRMTRVTTIDATGASVLADTISRLEARGITVLLSGVRPVHEHVLSELGVYDRLAHENHIFATTPAAIEHARLHAARIVHGHEPA